MSEVITKPCAVCGYKNAELIPQHDPENIYFNCPICGRYHYYFESYSGKSISKRTDIDKNKLASFFFYNGFKAKKDSNNTEYRYYTTLDGKKCDERIKAFNDEGKIGYRYPIHFEKEDVDVWYPDKFSDKIDMILLYFYDNSKHIGDEIELQKDEMYSCLFADRYDFDGIKFNNREDEAVKKQAFYILNYLIDNDYLKGGAVLSGDKFAPLQIAPKGYQRIDELQKSNMNSKDVFVAMQFGEKTKTIREAIKEGIISANYTPVLIDEEHHNNFIAPEILKRIKDSKFVVADLTYGNQGAYFEEGYAMGLGKIVIQLCNSAEKIHFDIAQKNTIMWEKEADIPELLKNRIEATVD